MKTAGQEETLRMLVRAEKKMFAALKTMAAARETTQGDAAREALEEAITDVLALVIVARMVAEQKAEEVVEEAARRAGGADL